MAIPDRVQAMVEPLVEPFDLELIDIEFTGATLRILVDRPDRRGHDDGIDLDALADLTRMISRTLDGDDPIPGRYTLEVSSPGLERRLRTPAHFAGAVDSIISVKLGPHVEGERRLRGRLTASDQTSIRVVAEDGTEHRVALADITKAQTVFEWGPSPKPGGPKRSVSS